MKIVIENIRFDFNIGCRLLKLKHKTQPFENDFLKEIWGDIKPIGFSEIAQLENVEERRVGILCLGLDRLVEEVNPKLISSETLNKTTTWINEKGELETKRFEDTYKLYMVSGDKLNTGKEKNWEKIGDSYFIRFKDTSTDREYMLWVDVREVAINKNQDNRYKQNFIDVINAIDCIAWTIQTTLPKGSIEKIVRQGDCILIKPKDKNVENGEVRHLTAEEYKTLLVAES